MTKITEEFDSEKLLNVFKTYKNRLKLGLESCFFLFTVKVLSCVADFHSEDLCTPYNYSIDAFRALKWSPTKYALAATF